MWGGLGDPGGPDGPSKNPPPNQELLDLKDLSEQQQTIIAQLKEVIRKQEQTSINKEKVDEYANTLTRISARVKKNKDNKGDVPIRNTQIDIPQNDKLNLLKQQFEANKVILAERAKSQKGIEDMVTQIKAQFDDSQQHLINQSVQSISFEKSIDNYTSQSNSEELYNVLVSKEENITELNNKIQKLEANVLDLQENLKEKDSVLDARTKAITLMTESLSKKGKDTLDALDDTKEQMRKMQENFITFETQMKMDKQKLIIDLEEKNNELCIVHSNNEKLSKEVEELNQKLDTSLNTSKEDRITAMETTIKQNEIEKEVHLIQINKLQADINDLNATLTKFQSHVCISKESPDDSEEIAKLRKQLDESNKNMIKTKAQHKKRVKELNEKIDNFKKVNDVNAELDKLEVENSRLNLKIAELEEEKGNLQLKLNESSYVEDTKDELEALRSALQQKDAVIGTSESTISDLNENIDESRKKILELEEKITTLSQFQNDQIKSEISSIDYEEKYDTIQKENANLLMEKVELDGEKEKLLAEIELLKKDKQELNQKLDSYMQENIELIDKLEKLSAEKVSSAESIEIVENLTQQEKLEIEAYQKRLDLTTGNIKNSNENLDAQDLNESVTQLNEETAELLQKIELFTIERREVMEKMDLLSQENSQLNMKIKEVEINRDMLAETYEHLQNEKELLDNKLEELSKQNKDLLNTLENINVTQVTLSNTDLLELENHSILSETNTLKSELEMKEDVESISNYQVIIEENQKELISSAIYINELENENERKQKEIAKYEEIINMNNQTEKLNEMEELNKEIEAIGGNLYKSLQEIDVYKEEIYNNSKTTDNLNEALDSLNRKIEFMKNLIEDKDSNLAKLNTDLQEKNVQITHLEETIQAKDVQIQKIVNDFKGKYEKLQNQIETNSESIEDMKTPLQVKINELENKNKKQLEKMKTLAANLKKKSSILQELEGKYSDLNEKWENECKEKKELQNHLNKAIEQENKLKVTVTQLEELQEELLKIQMKNEHLQNSFDSKTIDYNKLEEEFNTYKVTSANELESFTRDNAELINRVNNLEAIIRQYEDHMNNYQQEVLQNNADSNRVADLTQELNELRYASNTKTNALTIKISELEMYIENQETELNNYKEKVNRLVEGLGAVEKRRLSLENKAIQLGMKLEENIQQSVDSGFDDLEHRFNALKSHDEHIERQLQESNKEYNDLMERHHLIIDENEHLKIQLNQAIEKYNEINSDFDRLKRLEVEYNQQIDVIRNLENQLKSTQNTSSEKLNELENYCEKIEVDFQQQQEDLYKEKKLLNEQNEKFIEELSILKQSLEVQQKELIDKEDEYQKLININRNNEASLMQLNETLLEYQNDRQQIENQISQYKIANEEHVNRKNATEELLKSLQEENKQLQLNIQEVELKSKAIEYGPKEIIAEKLISSQSDLGVAVNLFDNPAENIDSKQVSMQTFTWPEHGVEDPFAFAISNAPEANLDKTNVLQVQSSLNVNEPSTTTECSVTASNETNEQLQKKIKTLEFMMFNVEKEKDDALLQCHELSNELTRLIYDKQTTNSVNLESQIVSAAETIFSEENRKELKKIEYQQCNFDPSEQKPITTDPVVEEVIRPKSAYLCYVEDMPDIKQSVKETEVVKETLFDEEDGWGFTTTDIPPSTTKSTLEEYRKSFDELNEKIRVLEMERENHLEEIKQCQIKSGKCIKKLKEFRDKNVQLTVQLESKKTDNLFPDLDDAIQDELKNQIQSLEKKLKEYENETSKDKLEKENLNKRLDVLTAANERMVEMKEKQDIEIISWQRQNRELHQKLEQMEWGMDEQFSKDSPKKTPEGSEKINELNEIIKDLTLDNEELQALLEEQRRLRLEAEKNKPGVNVMFDIEEKLKAALDENNLLREKAQQLNLEQTQNCKQLETQFADLQCKYESVCQEFEDAKNKLIASNESTTAYTELKMAYDLLDVAHTELKLAHDTLNKSYKELDYALNEIKVAQIELVKENDQIKREFDASNRANEMMKQQYDDKCQELTDLIGKIKILDEHLAAEINKNQILTDEIANLKQEIQQKQTNIDSNVDRDTFLKQISEKDDYTHQLINEKNQLEAELVELHVSIETKNNELQQLKDLLNNKDDEYNLKLSGTVEELNQQWAQRVDERGADVAESWKLHVESRENEFMQIEQQLRKELNELEEKCNALVNENNELRRNVDAEIRNEVDRISALQQQINDRNQQINELTHLLQEKQQQIEQQQLIVQEKETYVQNYLSQKLKEKDVIVTGIENSVTMLQEEVKKLQETIRKQEGVLLSKENELCNAQDELENANMKFDKTLAENQKLHAERKNLQIELEGLDRLTKELESVRKEFDISRDEVENLRKELETALKEIEVAHKEIANKHEEIIMKNTQLSNQQEELETKKEIIQNLQSTVENRSDGSTNLQFEIIEYKEKINDLENAIANKEKFIEESKSLIGQFQQQLIDYSTSYSTLEQQINEKDMYIMQINYRLQELEGSRQQNLDKIIHLEQLNEQYQIDINSYKIQIQEKEVQKETADNDALVQKEQEITKLKLLLSENEKEYGYNLQEQHNLASNAMANNQQQIEVLKRQMFEYETKQDEAMSSKLAEIESLQVQLEDANSKLTNVLQQNEVYEKVAQELQAKTIQCDDFMLKLNEQNILHDEESKQLIEMREIVEEQSKNIEELKAELYQKSTDYDSLISQISMSEGQGATFTPKPTEEKPLETADRAELDLALYMLHQRDVRCEELTVELMQLLEERDTLQLRLSNAIKEKEEIKGKYEIKTTPEKVDHGNSTGAIPKSTAIILGATGTELATEAVEDDDNKYVLANKLSELKTVGYKKDKNIVDEQEYRRLQQMSILQQHKDEVSKLPPEAAARLVDASYTLSRDVQSPSKVLLNWLWGRSTPKVNEL